MREAEIKGACGKDSGPEARGCLQPSLQGNLGWGCEPLKAEAGAFLPSCWAPPPEWGDCTSIHLPTHLGTLRSPAVTLARGSAEPRGAQIAHEKGRERTAPKQRKGTVEVGWRSGRPEWGFLRQG